MSEFFDLLNEVVFWFYENVWMTFFEVIYNNENAYFRYTMYFVVFIGVAGFLSEVLISFIFSFRLRKLIIFSPFKLKDYKAQYQDIYPNKNLTSRFIRQRFYNRDMSVLMDKKLSSISDRKLLVVSDKKLSVVTDKKFSSVTDKKLSVVSDKKLSVVTDKKFSSVTDKKLSVFPEKKISVIPYNVLNLRERRALIPRLFTVPEFRLYSALDLRHFESEVARSYHSIQEKDINERYDDSKRFSGLESNLTPRYLYALHPILTYRSIRFAQHYKPYVINYLNAYGGLTSSGIGAKGIGTYTSNVSGISTFTLASKYFSVLSGGQSAGRSFRKKAEKVKVGVDRFSNPDDDYDLDDLLGTIF